MSIFMAQHYGKDSSTITARVSASQRNAVHLAAARAGLPPGTWARLALIKLTAATEAPAPDPDDQFNAICKIFGLPEGTPVSVLAAAVADLMKMIESPDDPDPAAEVAAPPADPNGVGTLSKYERAALRASGSGLSEREYVQCRDRNRAGASTIAAKPVPTVASQFVSKAHKAALKASGMSAEAFEQVKRELSRRI
jgi:hypothetical protein